MMEHLNDIPAYMQKHIDVVCDKLASRPKLAALYRTCYPNTWETTLVRLPDGETFLYTGDIHAMWNRDATEQVSQYISLAAESSEMADVIKGVIKCQFAMLRRDPYANAFNIEANDRHWAVTDMPRLGPWSWEQKYETDTLCYPMRLAMLYWDKTGDTSIFDAEFVETVSTMIDQFTLEQHHTEKSQYTHSRINCPWQDTLQNGGKGYPVKYTGMTWQGFRPSDDACKFGYHIASNMFVVATMRFLERLQENLHLFSDELAARITRLKEEIFHGIEDFGTFLHPKYGRIYAYETDGFGNYVLGDDANSPSLLAAPFLGFCAKDDPIYLNTRRFILSKDNPYYYEGSMARGVGSPHTPENYVWPMGLCNQALTATDPGEVKAIIGMLENCDAGTGLMHEGFDVNAPEKFTREWFAASNSIFAEFVEWALDNGYTD